MTFNKRSKMTTVVLVLFYLIFPQRTHAYIDPGTGSLIIQLILASLLGSLFFIRTAIDKIKIFFKNLFSRKKENEKAED